VAQRFFNAAVEQALEECLEGVAFPPTATGATAEGQMLRADLVREMVARRERGESTRQIARSGFSCENASA